MLCAFPSLRWMPFWAALPCLIRLPKHTKSLTTSTGSLFMEMHALALALMDITLVLVVLIIRPVCRAYLMRSISFSCSCFVFVERTVRSSAKSWSSSWLHWMPRCLAVVVFRIIQSMAVRKRTEERMQPLRTPDFTGNDSEMVLLSMTLHSN